jgi:hypothetical protein
MRSTALIAGLGLALTIPASAQPAPPAPVAPEEIGDEFNGAELSSDWQLFHARYGWPDKLKAINVGKTTPGALHLAPYHGAWVRDLNAPFLFKTVLGDFDVRARVRMRSKESPVPGGTWSLGGLMARVPNGLTAASWEKRRENWHFITTGVGQVAGQPMTETKSTYNSYSSLKLRPFPTGWVELRLVRVGMALFALARPEGETRWRLRDRFYRMEGNPAMQVGLIAYTTSPDVPAAPENAELENRTVNKTAKVDALFEVDWIRGRRPSFAKLDYWNVAPGDGAGFLKQWYAQVSGDNPLADPNLSEAEVLKLLGD